jgi:uridine phosphorylase
MTDAVASAPIHLRPNAPVAERALLPGDPGRALRLAQHLLAAPMQVLNTNRGLWGYTGAAADGAALTIQSTGMGGPSAAIVAEELIALGARRLVRVGTCGALTDGLALGDLLVAGEALCEDGASRALGAGERAAADPGLTRALAGLAGDPAVVVSADLFYDPDPARAERWIAAGAVAVEMEAATLFTVARLRGAAAACALLVSDELAGGARRRIGDDALAAAELALGEAALAALGAERPGGHELRH